MTVDTNRQFINSNSEDSEAWIEIPLHAANESFGVLMVKPRLIPDLKFNSLENLFGSALEIQTDVEKEISIAMHGMLNASPKQKIQIQARFTDKLAEAQECVTAAKRGFVRWSIVDYKLDKIGAGVNIPPAKFTKVNFDGEEFNLISDETMIALSNCINAYGKKRGPLVSNLFEILFDYQNGITTTPAEVYRKHQERMKAQQNEPCPACGQPLQNGQQPRLNGKATPEQGKPGNGPGTASPGPL